MLGPTASRVQGLLHTPVLYLDAISLGPKPLYGQRLMRLSAGQTEGAQPPPPPAAAVCTWLVSSKQIPAVNCVLRL
jgi:hypothetical protein